MHSMVEKLTLSTGTRAAKTGVFGRYAFQIVLECEWNLIHSQTKQKDKAWTHRPQASNTHHLLLKQTELRNLKIIVSLVISGSATVSESRTRAF